MEDIRHATRVEFWYQILTSLLLVAYACELDSARWQYRILLSVIALFLCAASPCRFLIAILWSAATVVLAQRLFANPFLVANHHYCLFYLTLTMMLASTRQLKERVSILESNARFLAIVIMGFAVLHKVFSPSYMNGDYLGFMWAKGSYFSPFTELIAPDVESTFQSNLRALVTFRASPPSPRQTIQLVAPFPFYDIVVWTTAWSILAAEFFAALFLLLFPKSLTTVLLNGGVVLLIAVARQEFVFLSYYFLLLAISTAGRHIPANIALLTASGVLSVIQIYSFLI